MTTEDRILTYLGQRAAQPRHLQESLGLTETEAENVIGVLKGKGWVGEGWAAFEGHEPITIYMLTVQGRREVAGQRFIVLGNSFEAGRGRHRLPRDDDGAKREVNALCRRSFANSAFGSSSDGSRVRTFLACRCSVRSATVSPRGTQVAGGRSTATTQTWMTPT